MSTAVAAKPKPFTGSARKGVPPTKPHKSAEAPKKPAAAAAPMSVQQKLWKAKQLARKRVKEGVPASSDNNNNKKTRKSWERDEPFVFRPSTLKKRANGILVARRHPFDPLHPTRDRRLRLLASKIPVNLQKRFKVSVDKSGRIGKLITTHAYDPYRFAKALRGVLSRSRSKRACGLLEDGADPVDVRVFAPEINMLDEQLRARAVLEEVHNIPLVAVDKIVREILDDMRAQNPNTPERIAPEAVAQLRIAAEQFLQEKFAAAQADVYARHADANGSYAGVNMDTHSQVNSWDLRNADPDAYHYNPATGFMERRMLTFPFML